MDSTKMTRAFDLMALGLADAGIDSATIQKFLRNARVSFGLPAEETVKTKTKADFAVLAAEVKNDPTLDRGSKTDGTSKASGTSPNTKSN
jgi:hypothetical protein